MLEYWYKDRRTLVDFRRGPLGPYFDGFAAHVKESGYSQSTGRDILSNACQFNIFLIDKGIKKLKEISRSLIIPFTDEYYSDFRSTCQSYNPQIKSQGALYQLFHYLEMAGILKPIPSKPASTLYSWLLDPFMKYLKNECELTEGTIQQCHARAEEFLASLGKNVDRKEIKDLQANAVEAHIKKYLKHSPQNMRRLIGHLRRFLRFCFQKGYIGSDYSGVFPSVPAFRCARLPRGMEDSDIQRILKTVPRNTPIGARDYAMILLMMAYGLRGKSVGGLLLEDINWQRSTIRIRAQKGGKEVVVPLLEAVGEAIVSYLQNRGQSPFRNVFLTVKAPFRPLPSVLISHIVRKHMVAAGIKTRGCGTYTLRHSWAIRALAHDSPIKAIADVLGHKNINTTFIYAKADLKMLKDVVMPWPERS